MSVTVSLVLLYVLAAAILAICVLTNMRRSVLRGCVTLGAAVIALPVAVLLTKLLVGGMASGAARVVNPSLLEELAEALPSFEQALPAIVRIAAAPGMYLIVFILVYALLAVAAWLICRAIEKKKPEGVKNSKPIGAVVGAVLGFVLIIGCFAPIASYASVMPATLEALEAVENVLSGNEEQTIVSDVANAQKLADTPILKVVRALGGDLTVDAVTAVKINGEKTNFSTEAGTLGVLGKSANAFVGAAIVDYTDEQGKAIEEFATVVEPTVLARVLGAESLSAVSRAWLNGETFLGIAQPDKGAVSNAAYLVLMQQAQHMTAENMEQDVRALGNTLMNISTVFKINRFVEAGMLGTHPSKDWPSIDPATLDATVEDAEALLADVLADETTKRLGVEITMRVVSGGVLPEEMRTEREKYDSFIDGLTEYMMTSATISAEQVKGFGVEAGLELSDELCATMETEIVTSAYNVFYK